MTREGKTVHPNDRLRRGDGNGRYGASIVIPLLEQPDAWLEQCVRSAVCQTIRCDVRVVFAPGTPEHNLRLLDGLQSEFDNLAVMAEPSRGGFAAAINEGVRTACATRVGLLLSDDWLAEDAIEACLAHKAAIVSTGVAVVSADGRREIAVRRPDQRRFDALESFRAKASYLKHFFLFQRDVVLSVGGVDERVGDTGPDDLDLIWTLLEQQATVACVPRVLYFYRDHDRLRLSLRRQEEQIADLKKIFRKHGVDGKLRERLVAEHARWFGRRIEHVLADTELSRRIDG